MSEVRGGGREEIPCLRGQGAPEARGGCRKKQPHARGQGGRGWGCSLAGGRALELGSLGMSHPCSEPSLFSPGHTTELLRLNTVCCGSI